jgi:hypothetical protein
VLACARNTGCHRGVVVGPIKTDQGSRLGKLRLCRFQVLVGNSDLFFQCV